MSDHLMAWQLKGQVPLGESDAAIWEFMLRYAILAPSTHNTQPWLFKIRGEEMEIFADRSRSLRVCDPDGRELTMSCGAALFNLRTALRHFSLLGEVEILPEPDNADLLARVWLGHQGEKAFDEKLLFGAITIRRTNRQPFEDRAVPNSLLAVLKEAAREEGAWLQIVEGREEHLALADLIALAETRQWSAAPFRNEIARWVHTNRYASRDGIPEYAQGIDDLMSYAGPAVVRTFDIGSGQAAQDREIALYSPTLAVLGTNDDSPADWMAAGQALQRVLLRARAENVWASFLNQPIEVAEMRHEVADIIQKIGHPHIILRLGYGTDIKPTPRRDLDEVLI